MRQFSFLCVAALLMASMAAPAPAGQGYEPWDTKLRNAHHWVLKEEDVAVGPRQAWVNGEWQGNFRFELSNCPAKGCRTFSGMVLNPKPSTDDYLGAYALPGSACTLHVTVGERKGMDDGLVLTLAPTDNRNAGCGTFPRQMTGHYDSYWINHDKMDAQLRKTLSEGR